MYSIINKVWNLSLQNCPDWNTPTINNYALKQMGKYCKISIANKLIINCITIKPEELKKNIHKIGNLNLFHPTCNPEFKDYRKSYINTIF